MIADSGNLIDADKESLKGGRLGIFSDTQSNVIWSALSYR